jgi:hypothetical protein
MKKKKVSKKITSPESEEIFIPVHIHGIFDTKTKKILKVSLDEDEIDMELALAGCRFLTIQMCV